MSLFAETLVKQPFLIMSHRGFWGGNIIENSIESSFLAYKAGADIVELDICRTSDNKYYLFHDNGEPQLLSRTENFKVLSSSDIDNQAVNNSLGNKSGYYVNTLTDFLSWLPKDKLVNLDRSWEYWDDKEFFEVLYQSGKQNQVVLKSPVEQVYLDNLAKNGIDLNYIPILKNKEEYNLVCSYMNIKTIGIELIISEFKIDKDHRDFIKMIHKQQLFIVANAENLGLGFNLFGGLNDDIGLFDESHWEDYISIGIDVIQTDWPNFLYEYREKNIKLVD